MGAAGGGDEVGGGDEAGEVGGGDEVDGGDDVGGGDEVGGCMLVGGGMDEAGGSCLRNTGVVVAAAAPNRISATARPPTSPLALVRVVFSWSTFV